MPRWLQILLHIGTTALGAYVSFASGNPLASVIATGVSGVIGGVAQSYNTDGTSQTTAFQPATK